MELLKLLQGDDDEPDAAPVPDELLLELMDLAALAFPEPLHELAVSFVPNEDGKRPALSNLDGKAPLSSSSLSSLSGSSSSGTSSSSDSGDARRPDLGHTDSEVLDAINALLGDFADATLRQGGVKILEGQITIVDVDDGAREATLLDAAGEIVMTRRFDSSELRWLFFTRPLFVALNRTAAAADEQDRRVAEALAGMKRFDIDMKKGLITFSAESAGSAREPQPWGFELLGSFLDEKKRFLWGWANDAVEPRYTRGTDALRQQSTGPGLRAFSDAGFGGPEKLFLRLVRHAAVEMGAFGVYRAPFTAANGKGVMYLGLRAL